MTDAPELTPEQEERLARYRAGTLDAAAREAFEREVLESDALAEALYREIALDDAPSASRPVETGEGRGEPSLRDIALRYALPLAASLVLVLGYLAWQGALFTRRPVDDTVRGMEAAARPIAPAGELATPPAALTWSADPRAARYRVELYGADGEPLGIAVTADTSVAMATLTAAPVPAGEWRVVPIGADGAEGRASPRIAFRVR